MEFRIIIAMNVTDPARYAQYRAAMIPVLERFGGRFEYDMVISTVLKSPAAHPISRVFMMAFPSRGVSTAFFGDHDYVAAKEAHFYDAVDGFTVIAEVEQGT